MAIWTVFTSPPLAGSRVCQLDGSSVRRNASVSYAGGRENLGAQEVGREYFGHYNLSDRVANVIDALIDVRCGRPTVHYNHHTSSSRPCVAPSFAWYAELPAVRTYCGHVCSPGAIPHINSSYIQISHFDNR